VSWQLAAFALLALALAGGFAWYERARPDARIVALVGVLAAFAALGRIAFAPIPNVKPTTDIVLISGYALGGGPGFVVGALAGLTSNFFFGQGPWTPWQMAAWGVVGLIGALVASLNPWRLGRWPLAVLCALVGFAFAAVQDFGDWVTFSDHSLTQLGVYVGKGVAFDLVHAGGCFAFALAFGPPLARSVARFASRLEVTWIGAGAAGALAVVVALSASAPARAAGDPTSYLLAAQNADGGMGPTPGQASSPMYSGWAALGLASAGQNPARISRGGPSLLAYVRSIPPSDPGSLERTILIERAAGASEGGLAATLAHELGGDGSVSERVNLTEFAVLALRAANAVVPPATISWLSRQQNRDGGFSATAGGASSDVDDTGAALEALGPNARAVGYLRSQQNADGGFPALGGGESNAQSTAWAVQGLLAAGVDPESLPHSPLSYLHSLIAADGHVRYSRSVDQTPVWVTAQALMALERKPLPLMPASAGARSGRALARGGSPARRRARLGGRASPAQHGHADAREHIPPLVGRFLSEVGFAEALALAPLGGPSLG
jgi:energy-coupling factor transport system substrate-specific component